MGKLPVLILKGSPPPNRNAFLDTYCRLIEADVKTLLKNKRKYKLYNNLSKAERDALLDLKRNSDVVVHPADKGGAILLKTNYRLQEGS